MTTLPSVVAAERFYATGDVEGLLTSTLGRAVIIGVGLMLAGQKTKLVTLAIAGAVAIEVVVLVTVKQQLSASDLP